MSPPPQGKEKGTIGDEEGFLIPECERKKKRVPRNGDRQDPAHSATLTGNEIRSRNLTHYSRRRMFRRPAISRGVGVRFRILDRSKNKWNKRKYPNTWTTCAS